MDSAHSNMRRSERMRGHSKCGNKFENEGLGKRQGDLISDDSMLHLKLTKEAQNKGKARRASKKQKTNVQDSSVENTVNYQENMGIVANGIIPGSPESSSKKTLPAREQATELPTVSKKKKTKFEKICKDFEAIGMINPTESNDPARAELHRILVKYKVIPSPSQSSSSNETSSAKKQTEVVPAGKKKRKTKLEKINEQLEAIGISPSESNGNCARAAIYKGHIKLTGKHSDLDQVVLSGILECGHNCNATLGDLLEQPDYPGSDFNDGCLEATVFCEKNNEIDQCGMRIYVAKICSGKPVFDSGKFHNHCNQCALFGKCIGDWRNEHCKKCGDHFWAGTAGTFPCEHCGDSRSDSDSDSDFERRPRDDCVLM